ncbi:ribonuclease J [Haematospirillum jordaniae]|uniref:ribonuclease J n=1 Tax=Haematospirillum jordaniae TaxID=1549855 RepID=UPI001432BC5A|nr:MBL fold metallo-hydrolase [Haematospirillum jordaniae]NKD84912.1 ribonuclease J [Haematospirillum jordaniae]
MTAVDTATLPRLTKAPKDRLVFIPLGGTGEIGMNLNVYGCQGRWLAVDMGVTFGDDQIPGVDVVMPDHSFLEENAADLAGIVITHAHEDHIGAVAYLWPDLRCPVYATPFAAEFLRHKLKEEGLDGEVPVHVVPLGGRVDIGPFNVEFVSFTHSIPEPNGLVIRTAHGNIYHTGDWKLDPEPMVGSTVDYDRLRAIGDEGIAACVSDSTNILNKGRSGSEGDVRRSLVDMLGRFDGRVAVCCFASNIARVESIVKAARANGRQVCLVGRSLWRMVDTARSTGYIGDIGPLLEADDAADLPARQVLYLCTGSQGESRAAMARIAWGHHPHVTLGRGDVVLFSSRVIPGNEKAIFRLQNRLVRSGVDVLTDREAFIHVSGHPSQDEVGELYRLLRPTVVVPVHGERRHLQVHADFAIDHGARKAVVLDNGQVLDLTSSDNPHVFASVPVGRLTLEGDRIVPMDSPVLRDRKKMMVNGAAVITLVLDHKGQVLAPPLVTTHGLFTPDDDDEPQGVGLADAVTDAVGDLDPRDRKNDDTVREAVRRAVRRVMNQDQGRKPLTDVHLVRL